MEYENIRIDTTDISKIAQNTGMPEWKISRIKDHVFSNEHILDAGVKRFDADPEIADAWYRLTNGTYNQNDIDLLNHEYFESKFESFYKTDYRTAHNKKQMGEIEFDKEKKIFNILNQVNDSRISNQAYENWASEQILKIMFRNDGQFPDVTSVEK